MARTRYCWAVRLLVLLILVGCGSTPPTPPPTPPPANPAKQLPPWVGMAKASWPEVGLELATFSNVPFDKHPWPTGGVLSQAVAIGERGRAEWVVRVAPDETMRGFDDDHHDWTRSEGPPVTVCGRELPVAIATHAPEDITCVIMADGSPNHPDHIGPRAAYAIALPHRGMTVVAKFEVETDEVDRWRPIALAFLGSLRCN